MEDTIQPLKVYSIEDEPGSTPNPQPLIKAAINTNDPLPLKFVALVLGMIIMLTLSILGAAFAS